MWSCDASLGIEDAFDIDLCGYCGERFQASPPDWNVRGEHLVTKHNFGRCTTNLYSSSEFGEHLRHIHHAHTDTLTNTVFMRNFFKGERAFGEFFERSSQSTSSYDDLPKESAEVAALFQVQIGLLFEEFKQIQRSNKNDDALVNFPDDIVSQLQNLQFDVARIQEQFIVDGHSFYALNMSWDLCSCMRAQDLLGSLNPPSEIDRMNLIDDTAGKDMLGKWKDTRDRINWWLLHMLRLSKTATTLVRGALGIYELKESSENNWIRSVLGQWSIDEAATNHEWPLLLSDGAVDSRDDPHLMFRDDPHLIYRSSTRLNEIQPLTNAPDFFPVNPTTPEFPHSTERGGLSNIESDKIAIMAQFIKVFSATKTHKFSYLVTWLC